MIKFSDRQLKIPKLARPVYLVTAGQSKFDRAFPDKRTEELCIEAFVDAAAPVHVTFLSLLASVEADNTTSARKRNARTAPVADCSSAESNPGSEATLT